jgi:hypothetical protein
MFTITINNVNEAPVIDVNTGLTLEEDAAAVTIDKLKLSTLDPESGTVTYTVPQLPQGYSYERRNCLGLNDTFTQAEY